MNIVEKRVDELIPYANNPRYNEDAVEDLAESIRKFGFQVPIVIDEAGVILAGHTRLKAAKMLGMDTVPCVVADLDEGKAGAFRIADNKVADYTSWNTEILTAELEDLAEMGADLGDTFFSEEELNALRSVSIADYDQKNSEKNEKAKSESSGGDHSGNSVLRCPRCAQPVDESEDE